MDAIWLKTIRTIYCVSNCWVIVTYIFDKQISLLWKVGFELNDGASRAKWNSYLKEQDKSKQEYSLLKFSLMMKKVSLASYYYHEHNNTDIKHLLLTR